MCQRSEWSSIVIIDCGNKETVLVREPEHKISYWKFPGGKKEPFETKPIQTAVREVQEETGIVLHENDLTLLDVIPRRTHTVYLFVGKTKAPYTLKENGDEGEEVKLFPTADIFAMKELFHSHRNFLKRIGVTQ